jgi:hypothetical protein
MVAYSVHFIAHTGERFGNERFQASDDEAAILHARKHLTSPWGKGHELWRDHQLIHREDYK